VLSHGCHLAAAFSAVFTGLDALIHTADHSAICGAGFADFGADCASPAMETGIAEHEVSRSLADFGAVDHQTKVLRFNVFAPGIQAVVHRGLQTNLMALITGLYARCHGALRVHGLHRMFGARGTFGVLSRLSHGLLLN
jgi:hypothetical protein